MGRRNILEDRFSDILSSLRLDSMRAFTPTLFREYFKKHQEQWGIPASKTYKQVLKYLYDLGVLTKKLFFSPDYKLVEIFALSDQDDLTAITGLKQGSYFSHYSAVFLHQLTLQIPKTLYLNFEHSPTSELNFEKSHLSQLEIDQAFSRPQRKSTKSFSFADKKIILLNGKYTNRLGVIKTENTNQLFSFTDLERTLIDIAVRPVYAGGVFEVLEAYRKAKNKVDVSKLYHYLTELDFTYPYHQVIGFYLDKAGYSQEDQQYFRDNIEVDFYLTYDIRNQETSTKWRIKHPKGF